MELRSMGRREPLLFKGFLSKPTNIFHPQAKYTLLEHPSQTIPHAIFHACIGVRLRLPDMPCMKRACRIKKRRRYIGQHPGTKSGRRPAVRPRINRLPTAGQPPVVFPHRFTYDFVCSCFRGDVQDSCLRCLGMQEGRVSLGRTDPLASHPAPSRPAPPPRSAPPRTVPPVVCPGLGFDKYFMHALVLGCVYLPRLNNEWRLFCCMPPCGVAINALVDIRLRKKPQTDEPDLSPDCASRLVLNNILAKPVSSSIQLSARACLTGVCERNHIHPEKNAIGGTGFQSTNSGDGRRSLPLGCMAKACAKNITFLCAGTPCIHSVDECVEKMALFPGLPGSHAPSKAGCFISCVHQQCHQKATLASGQRPKDPKTKDGTQKPMARRCTKDPNKDHWTKDVIR